MKTACFLALVFVSSFLRAQSINSFEYGLPESPQWHINRKLTLIQENGDSVFRKINGKTYNAATNELWFSVVGTVDQVVENQFLILKIPTGYLGRNESEIAVKNYPKHPITGQQISMVAANVGTLNWDGEIIQLYDFGTPCDPPPEVLAAIEEQKKQAEKQKQIAKQKIYLLQSNTIVWLEPQASNGDAFAQCDLGKRFLNGQGCPTNREQAIFWLTKSADQGNLEASNKLQSLNQKP
jgi:hypothetical protein